MTAKHGAVDGGQRVKSEIGWILDEMQNILPYQEIDGKLGGKVMNGTLPSDVDYFPEDFFPFPQTDIRSLKHESRSLRHCWDAQ